MNLNIADKLKYLFGFKIGLRGGMLLCFLIGFLVRLIPEVLSYPKPIGFDTVKYAAILKDGVIWRHWSELFSETWLLYALTIPIYNLVGSNPFLLLKLVSPVLYGLNTMGIYCFSVNSLGWKAKKGMIASLLFSFQLASLRISWDLYKNTLGLGILLFAFSLIKDVESGKKIPLFVILSLLTVFSHEFSSAIFSLTVLWVLINNLLRDERKIASRVLASYSPALTIFLIGIYLRMFPVHFHVEPNIIDAHDTINQNPFGLFFLTNYLTISDISRHYANYLELLAHVISLFTLLYLLWLPLILQGFFRDKTLDPWLLFLLTGSFNAIITPFCALHLWNRWMIMLVYPFTFYATNGIGKILNGGFEPRIKWLRATKGILLVTILMSILFMALPANLAVFGTPTTASYFPSSMQQSTIPFQDIEGTIKSIEWLNENMTANSCVLIHHAFLSWAQLHLDNNHIIVHFAMNLTKALEVASEQGFKPVYLLWWGESIGWYQNINIPENFTEVFNSGRISVFKY